MEVNILANNFNANVASSNLIVGSDLTTGNLVMGSTNVSSNTTIVGGESIDISSNGDINFTASNSIFTGDIYGNYILANNFNANVASSNLIVGSDLTTGNLVMGSTNVSSNTTIVGGESIEYIF